MSGQHRIALIRCVGLVKADEEGKSFREVTSVSVKVHAASILCSLLETVEVQTHRKAALWHDAYNWKGSDTVWEKLKNDDTRFHLSDVFSLAQQFCQNGVCPSELLCVQKHASFMQPLYDHAC